MQKQDVREAFENYREALSGARSREPFGDWHQPWFGLFHANGKLMTIWEVVDSYENALSTKIEEQELYIAELLLLSQS